MSNAARKARKRAGEKFVAVAKVGTPLTERAWWNAVRPGVPGTRSASKMVGRSVKKQQRALAARSEGAEQ